MADIPDDMIFEILMQLPVRSLLRFKCVSKRLGHLINSPCFVKSHLKVSNKSHSVMIFLERNIPCYVDLESILNPNSPPVLKENRGPWVGSCRLLCVVVGFCNGLLCVYQFESTIFLWNPSTRKHVEFAVPEHLLPSVHLWASWGFGYDSGSDDYKVAVMTESTLTKRYGLWVYSRKPDLWEEVEECPYVNGNWPHLGVFANGALHWLVTPQIGPVSIVALDLGTFRWRMLNPPDWTGAESYSITVLDGCLHTLYSFYSRRYTDIWFMKDYGVEGSWTKLGRYNGPVRVSAPLAYTGNGRQMLLSTRTNELVLYYIGTRWSVSFNHWPMIYLGKPLIYIPSLVSPEI